MSQREFSFDAPDAAAADTPQNWDACPPCGIYRGDTHVSFEKYAGWKAINSGIVRFGLITPRHFQAAIDGAIRADDTKDRKLGRAIHCRLLEPETFHERFVVAGHCVASVKSRGNETCGNPGKVLGVIGQEYDLAWLCGVHGKGVEDTNTREVINPDELRRCEGVAAALKTLPDNLQKMFTRKGWSEASIVWEHDGVTLKGRVDKLAAGTRSLVLDLKKMQVGAGTREKCQREILNRGYHIQAAIYVKGIEVLTGKKPEFVWLFVEDNDPFDIQVIPADDKDIAIGWQLVRQAIRVWREAGPNPPGYIIDPALIRKGGLPDWYVQQWQEKYENGIG